jgi:hypothetical protein
MGRGSVGMVGDLSKFSTLTERLFQQEPAIETSFALNYGFANFQDSMKRPYKQRKAG